MNASATHRESVELNAPSDVLLVGGAEDVVALESCLEPLGHRLTRATADKRAIELIARMEFAVIVLCMEGTTAAALELVGRVQGRAGRTAVLVISGQHHDPELAQRIYTLGALDYLVKPVQADVLRWKVSACVKLYLQSRELRRRKAVIDEKETQALAAYAAADKALDELLKAERTNRAKDTYIGVLGHDLRNPLSAITMSAQLLLESKTLPERDRQLAERILRSSRRMRDMVRDVLDFTRSALGSSFPLSRVKVDLGEVCRDAVEELQLIHPTRAIRIESAGDLSGWWDPDRVEQVVSNLVANGLEHSDAEVTVRLQARPDRVFLFVHNSGPPIPEEVQATIFQPFFRGDDGSGGLGLGLYIVNEIVRAHGGTVEVLSYAQAGTTFVTEWPRRGPGGGGDAPHVE